MAFRDIGKYYISLEKIMEIVEKYCGKDNGFKAINLPINITMPESFILSLYLINQFPIFYTNYKKM